MGAVGAISGGIPERVDKQAWKIIEIKKPAPFRKRALTLDSAMSPLPLSKVTPLYRASEKAGPGKTTSSSSKTHYPAMLKKC
jgi:hypothetical protein